MLGSIPLITVLLIALTIGVGILAFALIRMKRKLATFMEGKDGASLEHTLSALTAKTSHLEDTLHAHKDALEQIDARVARSIRGYSLVRYNAYNDAGGEQSFASGLLDEHGDGYVLSVITNRNHVGVYAKKINRGTPESTLTAEEKEALIEAQKAIA